MEHYSTFTFFSSSRAEFSKVLLFVYANQPQISSHLHKEVCFPLIFSLCWGHLHKEASEIPDTVLLLTLSHELPLYKLLSHF